MGWLVEWWWAFWVVLVESGVWLLVGFVIAGVLHVMVPRTVLERALGGSGLGPVVRGALIGAPLPLCSCSVIPTAAGLKRSGASRGASAAFAVASPEVDVPAVGLTWGLLGPWFALTRPVVAVAIAIATGLSLDRIKPSVRYADAEAKAGREGVSLNVLDGESVALRPQPCCAAEAAEAAVAASSCCSSERPETSRPASKVAEVLRFAFVTLPGSLAAWMLIGLGVAALATVLVPSSWLSESEGTLAGGLVVQCLVALVVGVPLYVCATSSTPMGLAMLVAGVEPGAALVFLLAGPATNPATIAWVTKDFGARSAVVYVGVIAAGSLAAGLLLNGVLATHLQLATIDTVHEHGGSLMAQIAAGALLLLLLLGAGRSALQRLDRLAARDCCHSDELAA